MSDEQSFEFTPESYPSPEIENQLILELTSIPAKVEVPESLKKQELALIHEAGHATMALYHDRPILGYDCGSKSTWRESGYSQLNTSRSSKEGGLLWDSHGVAKDDPLVKDIAGGGVGSELLHFGYIRSNARSQSVDRELGGFKDFAEVLDSADKLADDLEGPLKPLYAFTLQRMLVGEGFDDINAYIRSGHHISTILKSLN